MQSLYRIRQEHINLISLIEDQEGEIAPHQEQALGFTLEAFQEVATSVGFAVLHLGNGVAEIDNEIKRLKDLKDRKEKGQEWLKEQLKAGMLQFGFDKVETPTLKLSFRKSEAVEVEDESALPASCFTIVPETKKVSKTAIKELIRAGNEVPGARLVTNQNLQIK
jgi:hypothetical protein